jgi:O-antigen ligase
MIRMSRVTSGGNCVAAGGVGSESTEKLELGVAAFLLFIVLAATAGAAVPGGPLVVGLATVAAISVARFGVTTVILHAVVLSMFFESVAVGSVRIGRVLAAGILLFLLLRFLLTGWRPPPIPRLAWLPALLFVAWAWTSGFWAVSSSAWVGALGALGLAVAYFLAFATLVESPAQVRHLMRTYVLGAGALSFVALAQAGADVRSVGLTGDPNIFALYMVAAVPAAGMLARTTTGVWRRAGWLLLVVPLVASVFAAQSRGALLAIAVVLPVTLARGDLGRTARGHALFSVLAGLGVVGLLAFVAGKVDERLSLAAVTEDRGTGRLDIWGVAWRAYLREPLLGLGAGGFESQSSRLLETTPGVGISPNSAILRTGIRVHSVYLETLTDMGPVGLLLWLAILAGTVVVIVRFGGAGVGATPTSPLLPMLLAFAIATIFLSVTNSKLLWMLVGLAAAAASTRYSSGRQPSAHAAQRPLTSAWLTSARPGPAHARPRARMGVWGPPRASIAYSPSAATEGRSPSRPQQEDRPIAGLMGNGRPSTPDARPRGGAAE